MTKQSMAGRVVGGISLPMAGLLVVFFFLPWLRITCQGNEIATVTGMQLAQGDATVTMAGVQEQKEPGEEDKGEARPWAWFGLALPALAAVVGLMGLLGALPAYRMGVLLIILGIAGVIVMGMAATVEYQQEPEQPPAPSGQPGDPGEQMGQQMAEQMAKQMQDIFKTERTGVLWGALALHVVLLILGAVSVSLGAMKPTPRARARTTEWIPPPSEPAPRPSDEGSEQHAPPSGP